MGWIGRTGATGVMGSMGEIGPTGEMGAIGWIGSMGPIRSGPVLSDRFFDEESTELILPREYRVHWGNPGLCC